MERRYVQLSDGRRALAFAEKEYDPSKGRVCATSCEKALLVEVELTSDNDYHIVNSRELGLHETEEDSGVWRGCMVFLGMAAGYMEEQAMLHLLRIAAAIDAGGDDWRLHGTARGLAVAALSIDHTPLELRGAEPPIVANPPLWEGGLLSWGILDGNQDGSIKARYIDNTFDAAFDTEPESDNGKFMFKCPHCGCDTVMNRRKIMISSSVTTVTVNYCAAGRYVEPCGTDDREDEIDMSDQTPVDVCCAQCGHYWDSLSDALDQGAFVEITENQNK